MANPNFIFQLSWLRMGLFYVGCKVTNPRTAKSVVVPKMLVDTGAESTWIDSQVLTKAGIEPRKKDLQFQMANGQIITRPVGYAILNVDKAETVDEVVFAQKGNLQLLGAHTLEGLCRFQVRRITSFQIEAYVDLQQLLSV